MKKLKNLEEGSFLKLFFAFFSAAFLIAAVCMPDRNTMFSGLWQIMSQPGKISTNYFAVGGYAAHPACRNVRDFIRLAVCAAWGCMSCAARRPIMFPPWPSC